MRILHGRIAASRLGHVLGEHARGQLPVRTVVGRSPHAAARYADGERARIARIGGNGMNPGSVRPPAEPLLALGVTPQAPRKLPRRPAIPRAKEAAADG